MNLKIGGNSVGKIMYGGQEFGGATKLEPGTILCLSKANKNIKDAHLLSTTKKWSNLNGINIALYTSDFGQKLSSIDISSDDFKDLDTEKKYQKGSSQITVSRSTVDGEYRLNVSTGLSLIAFIVKAI